MSGGREFQRIDAAIGNERWPTVARRYVGTCSWYDDDERRRRHQADPQHELADPSMAEPGHAVLMDKVKV